MIHYDLQCRSGHVFEAWFRSIGDFDAQAADGAVACPHCQDTHITRALMAPNVAKKGNARTDVLPRPAQTVASTPADIAAKQALRAVRRLIERNFEHVGDRFADEARKIHYGEADARAIYGDTTPEQAEALQDEGISIGRVPWVGDTDS